jgi:uncharacterized membrane-anchored protein YhcB (DUF1043 family)
MAQSLDMDTFPEAAELTARLNRDHNAELDEQQQLFADSRQKATAFLQLADTLEFLVQRLKDTYRKMHRAATTLQIQLPTQREKFSHVTGLSEWVGQDDDKLSDEAAKEAEARLREYKQAYDIGCVRKLQSGIRAALSKALKTDGIPHRVVNHMMLALKHDIDDDLYYCGYYHGAETLNPGIGSTLSCMRGCDGMIDILWDKSLTLSIQHPSKRRRTE